MRGSMTFNIKKLWDRKKRKDKYLLKFNQYQYRKSDE